MKLKKMVLLEFGSVDALLDFLNFCPQPCRLYKYGDKYRVITLQNGKVKGISKSYLELSKTIEYGEPISF